MGKIRLDHFILTIRKEAHIKPVETFLEDKTKLTTGTVFAVGIQNKT